MQALQQLSWELRELDYGNNCLDVERLESPPTSLEFYREYVGSNKPVIISGAIKEWQALSKWSNAYLIDKLGQKEVTVAVTPDGKADAVVSLESALPTPQQRAFCMPLEQRMQFVEFVNNLATNTDEVHYVQRQNSNLVHELQELLEDVSPPMSWAYEAFGAAEPEVCNFWMGNHKSVTSFHKDHYENLYAVVTGTKVFTLLPPSDYYRLYYQQFPSATYVRGVDGQLRPELQDPPQGVPWSPVDPHAGPDERAQFPLFFDPQLPAPLRAEVKAGEVLYLPSLWFHHVEQRDDAHGRVIAVNYWFDMRFDCRYAYYGLVERLAQAENLIQEGVDASDSMEVAGDSEVPHAVATPGPHGQTRRAMVTEVEAELIDAVEE